MFKIGVDGWCMDPRTCTRNAGSDPHLSFISLKNCKCLHIVLLHLSSSNVLSKLSNNYCVHWARVWLGHKGK